MQKTNTAGKTAAAGQTANEARTVRAGVQLDDIHAEQIAFLPDSVTIKGARYYRLCWTYQGEGSRLARVGFGWVNGCAVPRWATPDCGSARRGEFALRNVRRRGWHNERHGWDILIGEISDGKEAK